MPGKVEQGRAGFAQALAAEWTKLRSVRSALWTLAAMAAFVIGIAVFVGATGSLQPDDTVLGGSLTGATFGLLVGASVGVLMISGLCGRHHWSHTLACPRAASCGHQGHGDRGVALSRCAGRLLPRLSVGTGCSDCYSPGRMPALLGAACFSLTAHGAGGGDSCVPRRVASPQVAVLLLPSMVGPLFGGWERWIVGASPVAALQKLSQSSDAAPDAAGSLGAWPSLWLVCGYGLVALVGAALVFQRRDA